MDISNQIVIESYQKKGHSDSFLLNTVDKMEWRIVNDNVMSGSSTATLRKSYQRDTWIF